MFQTLFTRPAAHTIEDRVITFKSIDDFEYALAARSAIPLERINEAIESTLDELTRDVNAITVAIENIKELIDQSSASGEVTKLMKSINPIIFSSDNGWRELFFALKKDRSVESSLYKQIALKGYMSYLQNRQAMIQSVKTRLEKENGLEQAGETAAFNTGELDLEENVDCKSLGAELGMSRIGNGRSISLDVTVGDKIQLLLANYRCRLLVKKDAVLFLDNCNEEHPLSEGENKIGRSSECAVRFIDSMHRISRLHLIINVINDSKLELTDLSTYGTHYLKSTDT